MPVTSSGIDVKYVLERLIKAKESLGLRDGPAISEETGKLLESREIDDMLTELPINCYHEDRNLFAVDVDTEDKIRDNYQCFRTFRRTSDTRALEKKVSESDVDIVNRWKTLETAEGSRPGRPMRQHYAQLDLLMKPFLRYTFAM